MNKQALKEKVATILGNFRTYWKSPPRGYDVSYKEIVNFALGSGCLSLINILVQWTALATSTHMMISYFRVATGLIWLLSIVSAAITLVRSPILSLVT